jgi:hypothetical protein
MLTHVHTEHAKYVVEIESWSCGKMCLASRIVVFLPALAIAQH